MPCDLHHIVDAAHEPEVAVLVTARAAPGEVLAGVPGPVRLAIALVVLVDAAEHRGPRPRDNQIASAASRHGLPVLVHDVGLDAREREGRAAGLGRRETR